MNFITLDEIGQNVLEDSESEQKYLHMLLGTDREKIIKNWGEPDGKFEGYNAEFWYIGHEKQIILIYDSENKVGNIAIENN